MESSVKYQLLMSQLTHMQDVKDTEKTKLSLALYAGTQTTCMLRVCKNRDLSAVCESLRRIRNPNTAVVYDYVYHDGSTYILEECLSGQTAQEYMDAGRTLTEKETARIIIAVCNALEDLHREEPPVVHNDINPSNIMLREDGSVKLFDFDISRLYKKGAGQNTTLFGTEEYAAPEHYGYGQSEPRTDIYCLGATMHKMLTGAILSAEHRITYRGKLKPILEKCLQFDPEKRYASVQALRKDLERFISGKKRLLLWLQLGAVVCVAAVALLMLGRLKKQPDVPMEHTSTVAQSQTTTLPSNQDPIETTVPQTSEDTTPLLPPDNTVVDTVLPTSPNTEPETTAPTQKEESTSPTVLPPQKEEPTNPTSLPTQPPEQTIPPETAPPAKNNTRANAILLQAGQTYNESIEEDKVPDWYRFVTDEQLSVYRIYIDSDGKTPLNGRTILYIYDRDGNELKKLSLDYRKDDFADLLLECNQQYYIKVLGENTIPATGDYLLQITQRPCDAGTDKDSATPLVQGVTYTARADSTLDDFYVFVAEKTGKYEIKVNNIDVGAKLYFYGKIGYGSLFSGWAYNESTASRTFTVQAGDVIHIGIDADDIVADGTYTVTISPY